jgi:hypothetical protein
VIRRGGEWSVGQTFLPAVLLNHEPDAQALKLRIIQIR